MASLYTAVSVKCTQMTLHSEATNNLIVCLTSQRESPLNEFDTDTHDWCDTPK